MLLTTYTVFRAPMVRLYVTIPDDLAARFRDAIYARTRLKKGDISSAVEEAISLWLKENGPPAKKRQP
jgi:hypothetical protein